MGHEHIGGGDAAGLLGDTFFHGFAPMVMKRFEIIEKTLFIQSIVENGWSGGASPTPPLDLPLALGMLLNVCLLVLRLLFFEKFAGAPLGQKHKYGMGALHRAS